MTPEEFDQISTRKMAIAQSQYCSLWRAVTRLEDAYCYCAAGRDTCYRCQLLKDKQSKLQAMLEKWT